MLNRTTTQLRARRKVALSHDRPTAPALIAGGDEVIVIAGPCSVENRGMLLETAEAVRLAGGSALRGGAFKPRTSPKSFQGLGIAGLSLLSEARSVTTLPVVTEVMDVRMMDIVCAHADVLQIGARNMQNFPLLTEAGRSGKPVLLKRGLSSTIAEMLSAIEYIFAGGNESVILCERGIRTFETATRNTLDISAVPVLQMESHLPVFVDPSHAAGRADLVEALSLAAIAAGADGLLIEVHPDPARALSDGSQSVYCEAFAQLMNRARYVAAAVGRSIRSGAATRCLTDVRPQPTFA